MTSPILVTGALGNVGAEVVKQVLARGGKVRAADMDVKKLRERFGNSVESVRFDFTDSTTYAATFKDVKKMFYMRPPHLTNVQRDMNPSMDAAKQAGVTHVVFLSLIGIENAKYVPHYKVETYLHKINMQTTFLRCSFFMQNLNTTHRKEIKERNEIFVPVGNAKTSFIDARDIGAVAALALTEEGLAGKNYDLTGIEALDYWEAARIMSEVLGRKIIYRNPNPFYFLSETIRRGTPFMFALVQMGLYTSTRFGMAKNVTSEVEKLTGRKPIPFLQYVIDYRDNWL
ncbi:MAG: SDR family oxidoreductase [Anaerolineales bacterium]|uniref:SDR family oxidoreductase n=1 Tax=Candidatus Villigracilis affinis TaxID=3140682 RepID=UPI001D9BFAA1|nr:SDR family oxidoreductase [Anaerolineales bacterium]MBK9601770.1 SDR family oxidoreductase [Anaerolineales bacterium]